MEAETELQSASQEFEGPRTRRFVASWLRGTRRSTMGLAFAMATFVTGLVALPLLYRASQSEAPSVGAPELLLARAAEGGPVEVLNGSTLRDAFYIRWEGTNAAAVGFNLAEATPDGLVLVETVDGEGPTFDFLVNEQGNPAPFDTNLVSDGTYDLLVSVTKNDGELERTAARFEIDNG